MLMAVGLLAGCNEQSQTKETNISGALPDLAFTMTQARTGKTVTAADFKGKVTMLYFGYTFCPDICPLTLANVDRVLKKLGPKAKQVRFLFVTVDPNRDTLAVLKQYVSAFGPDVVGLRGNPDQIAALAKRYRVAYSVSPAKNGKPYTVSHSSAIYVFDKSGKARVLMTTMATSKPNIDGAVSDLTHLIEQNENPSLLQRLM